VAKKQNLQDWYDDYLEDEEIAQEVESLEEESQYEEIPTADETEEEILRQMEVEMNHDEYIANQEDEFARLLKEEVLPNSDEVAGVSK